MHKTVLITGASSGIGFELAKICAANSHNLVLVARNISKLEELKQHLVKQHRISVHLIAKDLTLKNAAKEVYEETMTLNLQIDYLINNAGFGDYGFFHESDWNKTLQMIHLNITTLTHLTRLYLPDMVKRQQGKIMNVASTAAFQPGPLMAVYYSSKAYVLHLSEAIHNEVKGNGVTVTALCPGPTQSGFQAAADMEESALVKGRKLPAASEVAAYAYTAMMKGKPVAIHGFINYLLANIIRFVPRALAVYSVRRLQNKKSG